MKLLLFFVSLSVAAAAPKCGNKGSCRSSSQTRPASASVPCFSTHSQLPASQEQPDDEQQILRMLEAETDHQVQPGGGTAASVSDARRMPAGCWDCGSSSCMTWRREEEEERLAGTTLMQVCCQHCQVRSCKSTIADEVSVGRRFA